MSAKLIQYWAQGDLPADIEPLCASWQGLTGWDYDRHDRRSAARFIETHLGERHLSAFRDCALPAMQSDFFRYAALHVLGGVYVDAATECLVAPDQWLDVSKATLVRKWHGGLWNGFLAAPPGHPLIARILDIALHNIEAREVGGVWEVTGPGILRHMEARGEIAGVAEVVPFEVFRRRVRLVNELAHKKGAHWSQVQATTSIYAGESAAPKLAQRVTAPAVDSSAPGAAAPGAAAPVPWRKLILHLGPHKTGTTTFQTLLEANEASLAATSIDLLTVRCARRQVYKAWRDGYTRALQGLVLQMEAGNARAADHAAARLLEAVRQLPALLPDADTVLISDENLLGPVFGHPFAGDAVVGGAYSAARRVFEIWREVFGAVDVSVYLGRRPFSGWVWSAFKDLCLKSRGQASIDAFFARVAPQTLRDYEQIFVDLQEIWGAHAHIVEFDVIAARPSALAETVLADHAPEVSLDAGDDRVVNGSLGWGQLEFLLGAGAVSHTLGVSDRVINFARRRLADVACSPAFAQRVQQYEEKVDALVRAQASDETPSA